MNPPAPSIVEVGDRCLLFEFGDRIDLTLHDRVLQLDHNIAKLRREQSLPGVVDVIPTFRSLALVFDPVRTDFSQLRQTLERALQTPEQSERQATTTHRWIFPACYEPDFAPDLMSLCSVTGLSADALCALHSEHDYRVYMLGFLPGFAFMGDIPETLRLPRRSEPRTRVPPGSVAIAQQLTAVYPSASPGGWHLLAQCPVPLFAAHQVDPALLAPGDRVRFQPVDAVEFHRLEVAVKHGELSAEHWRVSSAEPQLAP